MRLLTSLVVAAVLAAPAPTAAATVGVGDSFTVTWGDQDAARVTILDSVTRRTDAGRTYLVRVRYSWRKGQPVPGQWDWYPSGGRFRVVGTGGRARLPVRVLTRAKPTATGWMAWAGPADRSGVRIRMVVDNRSWSLRP